MALHSVSTCSRGCRPAASSPPCAAEDLQSPQAGWWVAQAHRGHSCGAKALAAELEKLESCAVAHEDMMAIQTLRPSVVPKPFEPTRETFPLEADCIPSYRDQYPPACSKLLLFLATAAASISASALEQLPSYVVIR